MRIVHNGVEIDRFVPAAPEALQGRRGLSLLFAGSLVPHKGVHTAIEAMALIVQQGHPDVTLTVAGSGHPDYEARLRALADGAGLSQHVRFTGRVTRERMPALLQAHDVLVFPSTWDEPLSRGMQEAMAVGLVVIGTVTGGSGEVLVEGETGLTFPPGDAATLARRIGELKQNPGLRRRLAQQGRAEVVSRFNFERTIDEIEAYLLDAANGARVSAAPLSAAL
jgi:glycosyltransferase involved in cell wall biosynthesis